ncbi:hypothetical protein NBRC116494_36230 [Aurantivibrio plasticivorans]
MAERVSETDENLLLLDDLASFRKHLLKLLQTARRDLYVLSNTLDKSLFDDQEFIDGLSAFVRSDRVASAKILVKDSRTFVDQHSVLRNLYRRLPSKLSVRQLKYEPENNERCYIIGDSNLLLYLHDDGVHSGFMNYNAGPELQSIREEFIYLWEQHGKEIPEFRELHI